MPSIQQRKKDHIKICLEQQIESDESPFDKYRLPYKALPEIDLQDIDLGTQFFEWDISFPFLVASMTGGEEHGRTINENVARACNEVGIPFGLGSMRVIVKHPEAVKTFDVKEFAPDVPMFANVGLVQLNYGFSTDEFRRIIDSVRADGLFIHVNHMQEAVQPEGDTNFKSLLPKLEKLLPKLEVPVVVKEVGHGFDKESAQALVDIGITMIDVAGVGGTSWAWVEGYRQPDYSKEHNLGYLMRNFGIPTDESILQCKEIAGLKLVASGGVRSGLDIAKALHLGADYASAAKPFLAAALDTPEAVIKILRRYEQELRVAIFGMGRSSIEGMCNP